MLLCVRHERGKVRDGEPNKESFLGGSYPELCARRTGISFVREKMRRGPSALSFVIGLCSPRTQQINQSKKFPRLSNSASNRRAYTPDHLHHSISLALQSIATWSLLSPSYLSSTISGGSLGVLKECCSLSGPNVTSWYTSFYVTFQQGDLSVSQLGQLGPITRRCIMSSKCCFELLNTSGPQPAIDKYPPCTDLLST